jgi:hypothetical protein
MNIDSTGYHIVAALVFAIPGWGWVALAVVVMVVALIVLTDATKSVGALAEDILSESNKINKQLTLSLETVAVQTMVATKNNTKNPNFIYRKGSGNYTNLTPREADINGLSYQLTPPTPPYTITSIQLVNSTGLLSAIKDGPNHVSVRPTDLSQMSLWIASRATALSAPHPYTLLLTSISTSVRG